jgi:hypothetical protein
MSLLDSFLLSGNDVVDSTFGISVMVCAGQSFAVVANSERKSYEGALGGMESDIQASVTAQPRHVTNPKEMLQKRCTVAGVEYRIAEVETGPVAVHFTLVDVNQPD